MEAINRYETNFLNTLEEAVNFVNMVNLPNVRTMADTYHLNIEEVNPAETIRKYGHTLANLHLADSNRQAPGDGHFDFASVAEALREVDFKGIVPLRYLGFIRGNSGMTPLKSRLNIWATVLNTPVLFLDELCCSQIPGHTSGGMERIDIMRRVALVDYGKLVLQDNCGDIKALEPGTVKIDVTACKYLRKRYRALPWKTFP